MLMSDSMVALNTERVQVDADYFEEVAYGALRRREISALESALAAYTGDLLPEDRYADWCAQRRDFLADLRVRLLLEMANLLEAGGVYNDSADRLRKVLQQDPTREDVHRRLMRLYTQMGTPDQAVRQFHACQAVLRRELDLAPQEETVALYDDILANRIPAGEASPGRPRLPAVRSPLSPRRSTAPDPFVGRADLVAELCRPLARPAGGGGVVLVSGEAGIGKTRLLEELAARATHHGAVVLRGGAGAHGKHFACGPFAVALEGYVASCPVGERRDLARRYPPLTRFVASLLTETHTPHVVSARGDYLGVVPAIVRLLTDIARQHPVLLVLDDLGEADDYSLEIIGYLAHLAIDRRWLLVGAVREEDVDPGTAVAHLLATSMREGLCRKVELQCLSRGECQQLVAAMLPGAAESPELVDQIYELSRGNPMFARELVQDACAHGHGEDGRARARWAALIADRVPSRVQALAETRLTTLDAIARRVVLLVAAAGTTEVSLADLRTAAAALDPPVGDGALLDALDHALERGFLEEQRNGYGFRHPLVRSALYERLSRHRRAQLGEALQHSSANSARGLSPATSRGAVGTMV